MLLFLLLISSKIILSSNVPFSSLVVFPLSILSLLDLPLPENSVTVESSILRAFFFSSGSITLSGVNIKSFHANLQPSFFSTIFSIFNSSNSFKNHGTTSLFNQEYVTIVFV
jgi:hypothetical protein